MKNGSLECSVCHETTTAKGTPFTAKGLAEHERRAHGFIVHGTRVPLACDVCGKTEAKNGKPWTERGLRVHKARVHAQKGGMKASLPIRFCPHCGLNLELLQAALTVGRSLA